MGLVSIPVEFLDSLSVLLSICCDHLDSSFARIPKPDAPPSTLKFANPRCSSLIP